MDWTDDKEDFAYKYFRPAVREGTYGECTKYSALYKKHESGREQLVFYVALARVLSPEEAKKAGVQPAPSSVLVIMPDADIVRIPCIVEERAVFRIYGTIQNGSDVHTKNKPTKNQPTKKIACALPSSES
eukprot:Phypoly_transcript_17246.p1 GENE.Phypoly_transcript_17246~~Phypoly_transcript_17246.p1  ORF type:complete len:130 (+),score=29.63 Phypoly_transcript_17246:243-632(+)